MIGQLIQNYEITAHLGEGGMGTVYKATDTVLGREVALKMLHAQLVNQSQFLERFKKEARILAQLLHPNIAVIYNFIEHEGRHYMVMEYVEGNNLDTTLKQKGSLSYRAVVPVMLQALEGLHHAHRKGIFHRDLKPANLIFNEDATVKLMDFGIARIAGEQRLTQVARVIGTLEYMAPELIDGKDPGIPSDIYALGITMYELLTGKLPFSGATDFNLMQDILKKNPVSPEKLNAAVPKQLADIIMKALHKKPSERFADAKEFQLSLLKAFPGLTGIRAADLAPMIPMTKLSDLGNATGPAPTLIQEIGVKKLIPAIAQKLRSFKPAQLFAIGCILITFCIVSIKLITSRRDIVTLVPKYHAKDSIASGQALADNNSGGIPVRLSDNSTVNDAGIVTPLDQPLKDGDRKITDNDKLKTDNRSLNGSEKKNGDGNKNDGKIALPETVQVSEPEVKEPEPPKKTVQRIYIDKTIRVVLVLAEQISESNIKAGQRIRLEVQKPVVFEGKTIIEEGAAAEGRITEVSNRKTVIVMSSVQAYNGQTIRFEEEDIAGRGDKVFARKHYIGIIRKGVTL